MARDNWEQNVGSTIVGGFWGFVIAMATTSSRQIAVVAIIVGALVGLIGSLLFTPRRRGRYRGR